MFTKKIDTIGKHWEPVAIEWFLGFKLMGPGNWFDPLSLVPFVLVESCCCWACSGRALLVDRYITFGIVVWGHVTACNPENLSSAGDIAFLPRVPFRVALSGLNWLPNCECIDLHILWSVVTITPSLFRLSVSSTASLDVMESMPLNRESVLMATITGLDDAWSRSVRHLMKSFWNDAGTTTLWGGLTSCRNWSDSQTWTVACPRSFRPWLKCSITLLTVSRSLSMGCAASASWILNSSMFHPMSCSPMPKSCLPVEVLIWWARSVIKNVDPCLNLPDKTSEFFCVLGFSTISQANGLQIFLTVSPIPDKCATSLSFLPSIISNPAVDK